MESNLGTPFIFLVAQFSCSGGIILLRVLQRLLLPQSGWLPHFYWVKLKPIIFLGGCFASWLLGEKTRRKDMLFFVKNANFRFSVRLCVVLEGFNQNTWCLHTNMTNMTSGSNITIFNRRDTFKWLVFYCHVSFPGVYLSPHQAEHKTRFQDLTLFHPLLLGGATRSSSSFVVVSWI